MKPKEKLLSIALVAVCLIYILLRFWNLTDSCLWFDEIFSIHAAGMDYSNLFWFVAQDLIHPPLFYVFLKIWISVGGETLFWLRFFPVFFSIIALIPFYLLCRQLKLSKPTVALAFLFFAANGNLIKYAQEVRMYSVLLCLSLFSLWLFARYLNVGKGIWFLTIVNILLVHTQYFGWFLIFAEVIALLYLQRIKIGQMMIMFGLTVLSFIPWTITVWQASQINSDVSQNLAWASKPGLLTLIRFLFNLTEPFHFQTSNIDPLTIWQITLPFLLIIITAICLYLINWKNHDKKERNAFSFLIIIIFTPILLAFAASWILPYSIWGTRHFIIIFAPFTILLAKIFSGIEPEKLKIALVSAVLIIFAAAFFLHFQRGNQPNIWCAWENFAADIPNQNTSEPTKLFVFEDLVAYQFWFALRDGEKNVQIVKINGLPELNEDAAYFLPRGFNAVQTADTNAFEGEKFYIAFRAVDFNYLKQPLKFLIERNYRIGDPKAFEANGLRAFLVEVNK